MSLFTFVCFFEDKLMVGYIVSGTHDTWASAICYLHLRYRKALFADYSYRSACQLSKCS